MTYCRRRHAALSSVHPLPRILLSWNLEKALYILQLHISYPSLALRLFVFMPPLWHCVLFLISKSVARLRNSLCLKCHRNVRVPKFVNFKYFYKNFVACFARPSQHSDLSVVISYSWALRCLFNSVIDERIALFFDEGKPLQFWKDALKRTSCFPSSIGLGMTHQTFNHPIPHRVLEQTATWRLTLLVWENVNGGYSRSSHALAACQKVSFLSMFSTLRVSRLCQMFCLLFLSCFSHTLVLSCTSYTLSFLWLTTLKCSTLFLLIFMTCLATYTPSATWVTLPMTYSSWRPKKFGTGAANAWVCKLNFVRSWKSTFSHLRFHCVAILLLRPHSALTVQGTYWPSSSLWIVCIILTSLKIFKLRHPLVASQRIFIHHGWHLANTPYFVFLAASHGGIYPGNSIVLVITSLLISLISCYSLTMAVMVAPLHGNSCRALHVCTSLRSSTLWGRQSFDGIALACTSLGLLFAIAVVTIFKHGIPEFCVLHVLYPIETFQLFGWHRSCDDTALLADSR